VTASSTLPRWLSDRDFVRHLRSQDVEYASGEKTASIGIWIHYEHGVPSMSRVDVARSRGLRSTLRQRLFVESS
jgi:hypothetical protein